MSNFSGSVQKIVDTKSRASRASAVNGVRVNRTGRRTFALQYKLDVVRQCSKPGVSVAGIALAHGINANLVRRWVVRHRRAAIDATAKPGTMVLPVTIQTGTSVLEARAVDAIDASTKRRQVGIATIEIELYGARIHLRNGVDAQVLRSVLDVLAQR